MVAMRNRTIDAAKGLGILLVVLGHSRLAPDGGALHRVIFSFHVPLFFVLSGVFLQVEDGLLPAARTRAAALLAPYFAVSLAVGAVRLPRMMASPEGEVARFAAGVLHGTGASIPWAPLWFLPHLFLASLCALALAKLARRPACMLAAAALLIAFGGATLGAVPVPGLPWSADLLPVTVGFVLLGNALGPWVGRGPGWRVAGIAAAGFAVLHLGFDMGMDLNRRLYGTVPAATLAALLGIVLSLGLASALAATRAGAALAWLGARTMPVLLFHWFLLAAVFAAMSGRGAGFGASALTSLAVACLLPPALHDVVARVAARVKAGRPGAAAAGRTAASGVEKNLS